MEATQQQIQPPWMLVPVETVLKTCYAGTVNASCEEAVANIMQLRSYKFDLTDACVVDFFVTAIWWCKENQLSVEQAGVVLDLARKQLVDIKVNNSTVADSIRDLKTATSDLVAKASSGVSTVPIEKLGEFVKFMSNMLIQHHKLWEFFFHRLHEETVICKKYVLETVPSASVPWPPPLFEGCPESLYRAYINPSIPASSQQQQQAAATTAGSTTAAPSTAGGEVASSSARGATPTTPATATVPKTQEGTPREASKPSLGLGGKTSTTLMLTSTTPEEIDRAQLAAQKALSLDKNLVRRIVETTSRDVTQSAELEIMSKIRERENTILSKINQVHKVAPDQ